MLTEFFSNPLHVNTDGYQGPLDVLLNLIRAKKKEITEISLVEICDPYLEYIRRRQVYELTLDCEFIEIASTLIFIKSRALLPIKEDDEEEFEDPEPALKQKLIAHEAFQKLSALLNARDQLNRDTFCRITPQQEDKIRQMGYLTLIDFLTAYNEIIKREKHIRPYEHQDIIWNIEDRIIEIKHILEKNGFCSLFSLVEQQTKHQLITSLMAILELTRIKHITLHQEKEFSDINCYLCKQTTTASD